MRKFKCAICGYIHDEVENGNFDELDDNYICPICGAPKDLFEEEVSVEKEVLETKETVINTSETDDVELSNLELSAICSNLSRGCEKQYLETEANLFRELSDYFNCNHENIDFNSDYLMNLINIDLESNLKIADECANKYNDRGAKRALTWSTKVTSILKILLEKYKNSDLKDEKVYVCTICGFVFIGNDLPDICPICKVQKNKFMEIKGY